MFGFVGVCAVPVASYTERLMKRVCPFAKVMLPVEGRATFWKTVALIFLIYVPSAVTVQPKIFLSTAKVDFQTCGYL